MSFYDILSHIILDDDAIVGSKACRRRRQHNQKDPKERCEVDTCEGGLLGVITVLVFVEGRRG